MTNPENLSRSPNWRPHFPPLVQHTVGDRVWIAFSVGDPLVDEQIGYYGVAGVIDEIHDTATPPSCDVRLDARVGVWDGSHMCQTVAVALANVHPLTTS